MRSILAHFIGSLQVAIHHVSRSLRKIVGGCRSELTLRGRLNAGLGEPAPRGERLMPANKFDTGSSESAPADFVERVSRALTTGTH